MDSALRHTRESVMSILEPVTEADERDLLSRIAARDREAMRDFYLLYHRRLARFLARITARRELVEDIVNEAFLIVWQRAAGFRGDSRVSTWVMRIAWRHGLASIRRERRLAAYYVLPEFAPEAERLERRGALERTMSALSPAQRAVVELAYVGGFSCQEIGAIMRCPSATVNTRLFHARRRLRVGLGADFAPHSPGFSQLGATASHVDARAQA